jgi:hypothetical protein
MPEAFELVDILVGQVYAAGEGDPAVDHQDFSMIPVIVGR